MRRLSSWLGIIVLALIVVIVYAYASRYFKENAVLKAMVARLEADSRVAQVLVTGVRYDEATGKKFTTIKFLEFDSKGRPLEPKYFTFSGNIIQFQSLVIRFDNIKIRQGDKLRGKSAYLFLSVFMLDGKNTESFEITKANEIPSGYKIDKETSSFEKELWQEFWRYALQNQQAQSMGIKNAQIEAPGTMFVPGKLYTIKIEHDGGLRIDTEPLPEILKGERV